MNVELVLFSTSASKQKYFMKHSIPAERMVVKKSISS